MRVFTQKEKHFIGTTALIVFCVLFFAFFQASSQLSVVLQGFIITSIFFLILPLAYVRLVLGEPFSVLGFRLAGDTMKNVITALLASGGGLGVTWFLVRFYPTIASQTLFPVLVETKFVWFVIYALTLLPFTLFVYDVFFRGMVQILWLRNTWLAVGIQALFFAGLLLATEGWMFAHIPLILTACIAGAVAKKTDSLWYAFLTSYLVTFGTHILFLSLR